MDARRGSRVSFGLLHNITALGLSSLLNTQQTNLSQTLTALSTGLRIFTPSIDVAGNALASRLQAEQRIQAQGSLNAQDLNSAAQVAQGGLGQINNVLGQITTL